MMTGGKLILKPLVKFKKKTNMVDVVHGEVKKSVALFELKCSHTKDIHDSLNCVFYVFLSRWAKLFGSTI